tara:strand:- start:277 stop:942 length:666 start_codon:yes stop_codon:yes gene_type:complete
MKKILSLMFICSLTFGSDFKSYTADFAFETKFGDFPLKRSFTVKEDNINTKVKMKVLWFKYSLDSNFKIQNNIVMSINTKVEDPFRDDPKKFSATFDEGMVYSKELNEVEHTTLVFEQLASDVQVRINAKEGLKKYKLSIFDNTKAEVIEKNYNEIGFESVKTPFGNVETIVIEATAEDVGPIMYYVAPSYDFMIVRSTATLKNGEVRVLKITEKPKFLEE